MSSVIHTMTALITLAELRRREQEWADQVIPECQRIIDATLRTVRFPIDTAIYVKLPVLLSAYATDKLKEWMTAAGYADVGFFEDYNPGCSVRTTFVEICGVSDEEGEVNEAK